MDLPGPLAWLVDEAGASPSPDRFLAELGGRLLADGLPLAGGALTLAVPHPIIARRTWLWRAATGVVIEALGFAGGPFSQAGRDWLAVLGPVEEDMIGSAAAGPTPDGRILGWAGTRPFNPAETGRLRQAARFVAAPLAAVAARAALAALLEAYLGRRSAARVQAGALRRGTGETIRAVLLYADLRGFTALSEATEPAAMIAALDAWFDRVAGAVHAFGGEVLWGNVGAADRLDFTAIGPAVNLVSRLEGLCRPLGQSVLISGDVAAEATTPLVPLGEHVLRGIAAPCAVFTLPAPKV